MSPVSTHGIDAPEVRTYSSSLEVRQEPKFDNTNSTTSPSSQSGVPFYDQNKSIDRSSRSKIFGLSPFAAGLLLGSLIALVLAAAIGGGLGATLASCRSRSTSSQASVQATTTVTVASQVASTASVPSSTVSQTATLIDYSPPSILQIYNLTNPCPDYVQRGINPKTSYGVSYAPQCGRDYSVRGQGSTGHVVSDVAALIAYTFEDCMQACSGFNEQSHSWNRSEICHAVSWNIDIAAAYNTKNANCWLKNDTCISEATCGFDDSRIMSAVRLL